MGIIQWPRRLAAMLARCKPSEGGVIDHCGSVHSSARCAGSWSAAAPLLPTAAVATQGGTVCFSELRHPCTHLLLYDKAAALERRRIESHSGGALSLTAAAHRV